MSAQKWSFAGVVLASLITLAVAACDAPKPAVPQAAQDSRTIGAPLVSAGTFRSPNGKGFELYTWQEGTNWTFALLLGTNRTKEDAEVTGHPLRSLGEAERAVGALAPGEWVTLLPRGRRGPLPPKASIAELRSFCILRRIHFQGGDY